MNDAHAISETILLVEDEPIIRMTVVDFLTEQGYRVEEAGSAKAALERIQALPDQLDVVVLDLGLPDRPGDALAKEIRAAHPDLPIVIASGQTISEMRRRFEDASAVAFLTKPYELEDLMNAMEFLWRARR